MPRVLPYLVTRRRFGALASLAVVPASLRAAAPEAVAREIEARYNSLATMSSEFVQTVSIHGRERMREAGTLFLRRPGLMRWQYIEPDGKLLVSDGEVMSLYNPRTNQVRRFAVEQSGDLRAPLAFLLGRMRLDRQFRDLRIETIEGRDALVGDGRTGRESYYRVEFYYNARFSLTRLRVFGRDESITEFQFRDEEINPSLERSLFRFNPPPGADVLEGEPGAVR